MVSVIIPVYNAEDYLGRCVDSIMGQTFDDWELLLIDDGSTDGSGELCKRYAEKDDRIIYIKQENKGAGAARKRGVVEATGEYVLFIDSDDYLAADAFAVLLSEFSEDIDCVVGQHRRFGAISVKQVEFPVGVLDTENNRNQAMVLETLQSRYGQELWNKLYRATIVKEAFETRDITVPYGEDSLYLIELYIRMRKIRCIPNITYHYEFRGDSLTRRTKDLKLLEPFSKECLLLKKTLKEFSLEEVEPLLFLHILKIALSKYRGVEGKECLIKDFSVLQDNVEFYNCAKSFLKRKGYFKKKYAIEPQHYYQALGLYKAIVKRDIWYYLKWYPLNADKSVSTITRIKAYINKLLGRGDYARHKQ